MKMGQERMENDLQKFEEYLSEFEPRRPRALPDRLVPQTMWLRRLGATAAVTIALGASLWIVRSKSGSGGGEIAAVKTIPVPDQRPMAEDLPVMALTQMALNDPHRLEAELAEASRKMLPDFRRSDSTLRVLAKQ
jgi:hypothetical protein